MNKKTASLWVAAHLSLFSGACFADDGGLRFAEQRIQQMQSIKAAAPSQRDDLQAQTTDQTVRQNQ